MLRLTSCPKCKGNVMIDRDEYGWYEYCVQCGHTRDMGSVVEAHEPYREGQKLEKRPISKDKIKVLIFSHQPLLQEGILHSLSSTHDIEIIGQAKASDNEATIKAMPANLVILDIDSLADNGSGLIQRLKQRLPHIGVIILSSNRHDSQLLQVLETKVAAYVSKEVNGDQLADMVRRVASGENPMSNNLSNQPELAGELLREFQKLSGKAKVQAPTSPLTDREAKILNFVAQGCSNKQIATKFDISEQTIKNHVAKIMLKLNANTRTQALVAAVQQGFISIS